MSHSALNRKDKQVLLDFDGSVRGKFFGHILLYTLQVFHFRLGVNDCK